MNWRKPLIYALLYLSGSKIPRYLREIVRQQHNSRQQNDELTERKLTKLLLHAYEKVPYYRQILSAHEVVADGRVRLENFSNLPLLTKDVIREEGGALHAADKELRKPYENTSGGSTGEPVTLLQDRRYNAWNIATTLYFNLALGKEPGESEIKFWGSDRDILEGTLTLKDRTLNALYHRKFFNSYRLGEAELDELIALNNRFKPQAYWSYMESAFELADYLRRTGRRFHSPRLVISTIGPLTEDVRELIESQFGCPVYNQYGSREVGAIACQCVRRRGLHTFPWKNYVEIVDDAGRAVEQGEGRVVVTTLENYSMPLIRYEIGDVAVAGGYECPCGGNSFLLDKVVGRTLGYFKKRDGSKVHSHFIVQALFFRDWIKRFQIVQDRLDHVLIRIELRHGTQAPQAELEDIRAKTKILMGSTCVVDYEFADQIERTASGKYVYTLCQVQ